MSHLAAILQVDCNTSPSTGRASKSKKARKASKRILALLTEEPATVTSHKDKPMRCHHTTTVSAVLTNSAISSTTTSTTSGDERMNVFVLRGGQSETQPSPNHKKALFNFDLKKYFPRAKDRELVHMQQLIEFLEDAKEHGTSRQR